MKLFACIIFLVVFFAGWATTFWKVVVDRPAFMRTWNNQSRALVITNIICFFGMMASMSFLKA